MTGITNAQIYEKITEFQGEHLLFKEEVYRKLDTLNGRVRSTEKDVGIALDRTKRIGEEIDQHIASKDSQVGGVAEAIGNVTAANITASGNVKVAVITFVAAVLGSLMTILSSLLVHSIP